MAKKTKELQQEDEVLNVAELQAKNAELEKKLEEAQFVLQTANEKIEELQQGNEVQASFEPIKNIEVKDEFQLIGNSSIIAVVESIYPAGQMGVLKTSAKLLINGERCVLSFALIKEMFCEKGE